LLGPTRDLASGSMATLCWLSLRRTYQEHKMKKLSCSLDQNSLLTIENASDCVNAVIVTSGAAKTLVKPLGARFVRLTADGVFFYNVNGAATKPTTDVNNGVGSVPVQPTSRPMMAVDDISEISVIAATNCIVVAEWWA